MSRARLDLIAGLLLLALCGLLWRETFAMRETRLAQISPALWTKLSLGFVTATVLLYVLRSFGQMAGIVRQLAPDNPLPRGWYWNPLIAIVAFAGFIFVIPYVGMLSAGALFIFSVLSATGPFDLRRVVMHAVLAGVVAAGFCALMVLGFGMILPVGELSGF